MNIFIKFMIIYTYYIFYISCLNLSKYIKETLVQKGKKQKEYLKFLEKYHKTYEEFN